MREEEIINEFKHRFLNTKVNNYIFTGINDFKILDKIPSKCSVTLPDNDINIDYAENIKINLKEVEIQDIISYTLNLLKRKSLLDSFYDCHLDFKNKFDLFKFQSVLRTYNRIIQLIFYNLEKLSKEEQILFNELYYFNSVFFNINSFIKGDNFKSYFLLGDRVLDNRENYEKVHLFKI